MCQMYSTDLFVTALSPDDNTAADETGIYGTHSVALHNTCNSSNDYCAIIPMQIICVNANFLQRSHRHRQYCTALNHEKLMV